MFCPSSENFKHFRLLIKNHGTDFKQIWYGEVLGQGLPCLFVSSDPTLDAVGRGKLLLVHYYLAISNIFSSSRSGIAFWYCMCIPQGKYMLKVLFTKLSSGVNHFCDFMIIDNFLGTYFRDIQSSYSVSISREYFRGEYCFDSRTSRKSITREYLFL